MEALVHIAEFVEDQVEENRRRWYAAADQLPGFEFTYLRTEKSVNQKKLMEQLDWLSVALNKPFRGQDEQKRFSETAGRRFKTLGKEVLGLTEKQLSVFEKEGLIELSRKFFEAARSLDVGISMEDIFQASRNVWTAVYLQILLGLEAKLTPAIFAYSMLYPVTDNFLDDPKRSHSEKVEFNQHFCAWLQGKALRPINPHEVLVVRLVKMIESQYPRETFPQVYESLLAIFYAQQESILLPKGPVVPNSVDVLGITFRKGGTSVLADGVLAAGELSLQEMKTIFDYGCFAQLMDDQEDVESDLGGGRLTVFSEAAGRGKLDLTMNRLFSFSRTILKELDSFLTERSTPLIEVSLKGIDLLLIDACARTHAYYSRKYLAYLESFFPISFGSLNRLNRKIQKRHLSMERLMNAFFVNENLSSAVSLTEGAVPLIAEN